MVTRRVKSAIKSRRINRRRTSRKTKRRNTKKRVRRRQRGGGGCVIKPDKIQDAKTPGERGSVLQARMAENESAILKQKQYNKCVQEHGCDDDSKKKCCDGTHESRDNDVRYVDDIKIEGMLGKWDESHVDKSPASCAIMGGKHRRRRQRRTRKHKR